MTAMWVRHAGLNGWRSDGTITAQDVVTSGNLWTKVLRLCAVADGGKLDRVTSDAGDPLVGGFLGGGSLGPPGGGLATLLDLLPREVTGAHLGPLFEQAGLSLREAPGVGSGFVRGLRWAAQPDLEAAVRLGEDPRLWHRATPGALRASSWVDGVAAALAAPESRRALLGYWAEVVRSRVDGEAARALGVLPFTAPREARLQQAVAVYVALAHLDPKGALRLLVQVGPDGARMLDVAGHPGAWSKMLGSAAGRVRAALGGMVWG